MRRIRIESGCKDYIRNGCRDYKEISNPCKW